MSEDVYIYEQKGNFARCLNELGANAPFFLMI